MPFPARLRPVATGLILVLSGWPLPAAAAAVTASYRIHVGGVEVLEVDAELTVTEERYDVKVQARTGGFIGRMFAWDSRSQSVGVRGPGGLSPQRHTQVSTFRDKPRSVTLAYDGQGGVTATVLPPPEDDDREPVPAALLQSTYDPLSGVLSALVALGRGEGCTRTMPVFDGRRRYDMMLYDAGLQQLARSRYSIYSGPAQECRITYKPVAGYNRRPTGPSWLRDSGQRDGIVSDRPPVDLWVAPLVPGLPPLPVRVETDSAFGSVVVHLTAISPPPAAK